MEESTSDLPKGRFVCGTNRPTYDTLNSIAEELGKAYTFPPTGMYFSVLLDGVAVCLCRVPTGRVLDSFTCKPTLAPTFELDGRSASEADVIRLFERSDAANPTALLLVQDEARHLVFHPSKQESIRARYPDFFWGRELNGPRADQTDYETVFADLSVLGLVHLAESPPREWCEGGFESRLVLHLEGVGTKWKTLVGKEGSSPISVGSILRDSRYHGNNTDLLPCVHRLWRTRQGLEAKYPPESLMLFGYVRNAFTGFTGATGPIFQWGRPADSPENS